MVCKCINEGIYSCSFGHRTELARVSEGHQAFYILEEGNGSKCGTSTTWVVHHLKQFHNISNHDAQQLLNSMANYRRKEAHDPKPRVDCPVSGCYLSVVRLDHHLKRVHHITKKDLINTAVNTVDLSTPSLLLNLPVDNALASQISKAICGQSQCIVENLHSFVENFVSQNVQDSRNTNELIDAFQRYIGSLDGGKLQNTKQYALDVKQIVACLGGKLTDITKENVELLYVQPYMARCQDKTLQKVPSVYSVFNLRFS